MPQENGFVKSDSQIELISTNQFEPIEIQHNRFILTPIPGSIFSSEQRSFILELIASRNEWLAKKERPLIVAPNLELPIEESEVKSYLALFSLLFNVKFYKEQTFWKTERVEILQRLVSIISQGWAYRGGVKVGGNSQQHIRDTQILSLDFDKDQLTSKTEKDEFFLSYACLWYKTPSYTPENNKHRVLFILDRPISTTEYELIYKWFMLEKYPHADDTLDAGRLFYGARPGTESVYTFGEGLNRLPVDAFLKLASEAKQHSETEFKKAHAKAQGKKAVTNGHDKGSSFVITNPVTGLSDDIPSGNPSVPVIRGDVTEQVLAHMYEHLFLGVYKGDAGALYSYHNPNQVWQTREPEMDKNEVLRIAGSNPFSATDSNKSSFMVIQVEDKMPRFWDKSGEFGRILMRESGKESAHGTYLDYYFHIRKTQYDDFQDIEYQSDGSFPKGFFVKLVNHLCLTFRLPRFSFAATQFFSAVKQTLSGFDGKLFHQGWMESEKEVVYAVWNDNLKCYRSIHLSKFTRLNFIPQLEADHDNIADLFETWWVEAGKKSPPRMSATIQTWLEDHFKNTLDEYPKTDRQLVPYQNGVFNLKSHQFEDYNSSSYISFNAPLNYTYYPVADDHPVIENLLSYFTDWMNCPIKGQLLLSYLVLCVQREAFRLRHMVVLMGKKKMGKSTYGQLVTSIVRGTHPNSKFGKLVEAAAFLSSDKFSNESIEDAYVIYLEEMNTFNKQSVNYEKLKVFITAENFRYIELEPKYAKKRTVEVYTGFIGGCEDVFKLNTSDGLDDRIIYVKIDDSLNMNLKDRVTELEKNPEVIHNWCMTQDTDFWLKQFRDVCQDSIFKSTLIEKKRESEPLIDFIENNFELTESEEDTVQASTIWDIFREYRQATQMNRDYSSSIAFGIAFTRILSEDKYGLNWKGKKEKKEQKAEGKRKNLTFYSHLRVLTTNTETSNF